MHDFVTLEVTDERVARLHRMQDAIGLRPLEKRAQFHKMMAAAACIETVKRDDIFLVAIQRLPIGRVIETILRVVAVTFCFHFEAKQIALFMAGKHFFHRSLYFLGRELRGHNIVLVRNDVPDVVNRFRAGDQVGFSSNDSVHHAIDRHVSFQQHFHDCRADQPLDVARPAGPASTPQRLGQFADRLGKSGCRFGELRFRS